MTDAREIRTKPATPGNATEERAKSKRIGSLRALGPFLAPYKAMLAAAIGALILTAIVSLTLPLAVRRVVDGFETSSVELLDQYFLALLGVAIVFAGGAALRFYLVTRLGERVVADIRKAVFDRMIGMSPAFFERVMTGEVLSRITTDTTLLLSVISSSASITNPSTIASVDPSERMSSIKVSTYSLLILGRNTS